MEHSSTVGSGDINYYWYKWVGFNNVVYYIVGGYYMGLCVGKRTLVFINVIYYKWEN